MKRLYLQLSLILVLTLTGFLAASSATADDRPWGKRYQNREMNDRYDRHRDHDRRESYDRNRYDRRGHHDRRESYNRSRYDGKRIRYFNDRHRHYFHDYYSRQYWGGYCPPGLVKNGHRFISPYHSRRWAVGRILPRDVVYYDLPPSAVVHLGPVPAHHRFVRVAQDILLIAVGTGMVVDAIDDLSWEFDR